MTGLTARIVDKPAEAPPAAPEITWEVGTAYDLFISLHVLHQPEDFGLRGSWAAGVRSRLPADERKLLEDAAHLLYLTNLPWIHALPEPRDGATAIWTLARLAPEERLPALMQPYDAPSELIGTLQNVSARRKWDEGDRETLRKFFGAHKKHHYTQKDLAKLLDWWAAPAEFGERCLSTLRSYYEAFFAEEERRILPALQTALDRARELSEKLDVPALLETLSQGVRFESLDEIDRLVLAPSFWSTPFIFYDKFEEHGMVIAFGGRPSGASLVPGEEVPDAMLQALKAMADPTRLRILRYLTGKAMTPADLSRRLRLRPPTVVHHLHALRLAGLVHLTLETGGERRYAVRREMIGATFEDIQDFLKENK